MSEQSIHLPLGSLVRFRERVWNAFGDVREKEQTAVVMAVLPVDRTASVEFATVEWGLLEGFQSRPERGQLHDVPTRLLDVVDEPWIATEKRRERLGLPCYARARRSFV